jgi:Protein of unknown function (DUF726)
MSFYVRFLNGQLDDPRLPYSVLDPVVGDVFSVLWEPEMIRETGSALRIMTAEVLSQVGQTVLAATAMTALMSALQWPISKRVPFLFASFLVDHATSYSPDQIGVFDRQPLEQCARSGQSGRQRPCGHSRSAPPRRPTNYTHWVLSRSTGHLLRSARTLEAKGIRRRTGCLFTGSNPVRFPKELVSSTLHRFGSLRERVCAQRLGIELPFPCDKWRCRDCRWPASRGECSRARERRCH